MNRLTINRTGIIYLLLAWTLIATGCRSLQAIEFGIGPYASFSLPSFETINRELFSTANDPLIGGMSVVGGQARVYWTKRISTQFSLGYSGQQTSPHITQAVDSFGQYLVTSDTINYSCRLKLIPLEAGIGYSSARLLRYIRISAGACLGYTWGDLRLRKDRVDQRGTVLSTETERATGRAATSGFTLGLDVLPSSRIAIGLATGYRYGAIDRLRVRESTVPMLVGRDLAYYDPISRKYFRLPLELAGSFVKASVMLVF